MSNNNIPLHSIRSLLPLTRKSKGKYRCSVCNETGHNRRTCPVGVRTIEKNPLWLRAARNYNRPVTP